MSCPRELGLGTGAVFMLVPYWFPDQVGTVTGVVGTAGGLGGFFPTLVMAIVKTLTGSYSLGFILLALVAVLCLVVLIRLDRTPPAADAGMIASPRAPAVSSRQAP